MAIIRKKIYESSNTYQDIFKRIRIDVERVSTLIFPIVGNLTTDTDKFWVGNINSSDGTFKIVRTNSSVFPFRIFKGNFFTIIIQGQVSSQEDKTKIEVKFRLVWHVVLLLFFLFILPFMLLISFINQNDLESIRGLIPFFLLFDFLPLLLLKLQLDRTEILVAELLGTQ
jgi:hypothetical protein